ncbi:glycosyltransferase [uncultured Mediterranea sp.]|uniref:glycosyltransferase family 2 protein n=1 Tax=uncultured Mediterranea sp. TaxID=1926662 RepID=UPI0027D9BD63|nr:glycosyltransferase [uncultured Mediterranea sp.]
MKKVTLLIPVYNEEENLPTLYQRLTELIGRNGNYEWEILFVNDGSSDHTLDAIRSLRQKNPQVNYVNLSRNFGKEIAMLAGFDFTTGDCCVIMDADLQDPPELVDQMLAYWEEGYDDIYAKRRSRGEESWMRSKLSLTFYKLLQKMSRIDILPNVGDFRLLDRRCVLTLRRLREHERYTKGLFCWIGYRKKGIEFDRGDRVAGQSSWSFLKLLNLAIEGITSSSTAPLRIATVCGILCSISSFIYAIYFLIKTLIFGDQTTGFPTLIVTILFLGGIQLFSLGVIGEYIGRIFKETKGRPTYIASEYNEKKLGYSEETFPSLH